MGTLYAAFMLAAVTITVASLGVSAGNATKPHIVFVMADDFGWANLGAHAKGQPNEAEALTPRLDSLIADGVLLDRHYVFSFCSPSRCAFTSGRNPIHVNLFNDALGEYNLSDPVSGYSGIPRNMTGIAEKLSSAGYSTVAAGKWDAGLATPDHTPHGRGYNSSLTYLSAANDYWSNIASGAKGNATSQGFCMSNESFTDLWKDNAPAFGMNNSWACRTGNEQGCIYEDELFNTFIVDSINAHDLSRPLFVYYAPHAVHAPLEVPAALLSNFSFISNTNRAHYAALANSLDTLVGNVVDALVARGMWEDTLLVFSSDNGGPVYISPDTDSVLDGSGNNWPLRGGKVSNWEGGVRVNAFASGGFIPPARRGTVETGLAGVEDWYSTFCALAGVDPTDTKAAAAGLPAIDSLDLWPLISGANLTSPRTEVILGFGQLGLGFVQGIIRSDGWKLLRGELGFDFWQGPLYPNASTETNVTKNIGWCGIPGGPLGDHCLFNVLDDPSEHDNRALAHPDIVAALSARLKELETTLFAPARGKPGQVSCDAANTVLGGFIGPFLP